jgi:hypothetical protein
MLARLADHAKEHGARVALEMNLGRIALLVVMVHEPDLTGRKLAAPRQRGRALLYEG